MRKLIPVVVMAGVIAAGAMFAPKANAQTYTNVKELKPFSPAANYMSLPGYLRYRFLVDSGRWITREEAVNATTEQGAPTGTAMMG